MLALASGLAMSFLAVSTRSLRTLRPEIIIFYYTLFGLIITSIFIPVEMSITSMPSRLMSYTGRQYWIVIAVSAFDAGSMIGNTFAYQSDRSGFVSLISYMSIVYAYMSDTLIFGEGLRAIELIAAIVILVVAVGVAAYKLYIQNKEKAKQPENEKLLEKEE